MNKDDYKVDGQPVYNLDLWNDLIDGVNGEVVVSSGNKIVKLENGLMIVKGTISTATPNTNSSGIGSSDAIDWQYGVSFIDVPSVIASVNGNFRFANVNPSESVAKVKVYAVTGVSDVAQSVTLTAIGFYK